jgi:hypothetical protein
MDSRFRGNNKTGRSGSKPDPTAGITKRGGRTFRSRPKVFRECFAITQGSYISSEAEYTLATLSTLYVYCVKYLKLRLSAYRSQDENRGRSGSKLDPTEGMTKNKNAFS